MSNNNKVVFHYNKGDDGCISIEFVWNDKRACIFFEKMEIYRKVFIQNILIL